MFSGLVRDDRRVVADGSSLNASVYDCEVCNERKSIARDLSILSSGYRKDLDVERVQRTAVPINCFVV